MSLPNVSFTNNLGTIQFVRCLLGITDSWEYNGRVARHVKSISVQGHVLQGGIGEQFTGIITNRSVVGQRYGDIGTLTLPWTTLTNIRLTDLSFPDNVWLDYVPVEATFADDYPDGNQYTITLFGFTVYNPRIQLPIPDRQLRDEYPLQPLLYTVPAVGNPRYGVFRTRAGQKNMEITITGSIRITDVKLPPYLIDKLTQRANTTISTMNALIPTGYPNTFNLGDAIPEIRNDLNYAHCMVIGSQIQWNVEQQMAMITVQMLCPPQTV
jgi:hypothetical protein